MSCGVGHRCGLDPMLLWLWHRLAATALIRPLAWEPPYAMSADPRKDKKKKKKDLAIFPPNIIIKGNIFLFLVT